MSSGQHTEPDSPRDEIGGLARLVIDLIADAIPGTPSRVVSVLAAAGFDTAEAARVLGKSTHYVRTNLDRFVAQARERCAGDRAIRLIVSLVFSGCSAVDSDSGRQE